MESGKLSTFQAPGLLSWKKIKQIDEVDKQAINEPETIHGVVESAGNDVSGCLIVKHKKMKVACQPDQHSSVWFPMPYTRV